MPIFLKSKLNNKSFTLIELLIVIAILALLMSIIIITLNPSEMLKKSRDTKRISSLKALNNALGIFQATKPTTSTGTAYIVYISIPDSSSTCSNLSLPTLPDGYTYQCSTVANYRKTDGTGWIPVNFNSLDIGSPISSLPIDPTNTTSTNLFFTYTTGGSWELNAILESSANKLSGDNDKTSLDGGDSYSTYEIGTDLSLAPYKDTGLVGYWKFDKYTSGSIANSQTLGLEDSSGYNYNGTATNTDGSGFTWINGKTGGAINIAAYNGDDLVTVSHNDNLDFGSNSFSVSAWVYPDSSATAIHWCGIVKKSTNWTYNTHTGYHLSTNGGSLAPYSTRSFYASIGDGVTTKAAQDSAMISSYGLNQWHYVAMVTDRTNNLLKLYVDGNLKKSTDITGLGSTSAGASYNLIFVQELNRWVGGIDEIRIYNRALSDSEIVAIYGGMR